MDAKILRDGKIYELQHELRLSSLRIKKHRNELTLATSEIMEVEELHLELDNARKALNGYCEAVNEYMSIRERLAELDAQVG